MNDDAAYWATRNLHGMGWVDAERARLGLPEMGWDVGEEGELVVPEGMRRPTRWIQRDDHGGLLVPPNRGEIGYVMPTGVPGFVLSFDVATDGPPNSLIQSLNAMFAQYSPPEPRVVEDWPDERVTQTEPVRAFKRAELTVCRDDGGHGTPEVHFSGIGMTAHYLADDTAYHPGYTREEHPAPDPTGECRECGFYAMPDPEALDDGWGAVMLEVELFGTVIEHARGYRASRQRVLCVWVDTMCGRCCDPDSRAAGLWVDQSDELVPRCTKCMPLGLVRLADVASMVGCEVRWADD